MSQDPVDQNPALLAHTAQIVSAYVAANKVEADKLADLIAEVYQGLKAAPHVQDELHRGPAPDPAVPIEQSLTEDALICLEDGLPFQSLKRHLRVKYNLTPEAYRKKWGLPPDYPMVAPNYAKRRSALAKRTGLGKNKR